MTAAGLSKGNSSMNKNAKWIYSPKNKENRVITFSKKISLSGEVKKATLCASAMGLYFAEINGARVTDAVFTPGWTSGNVHTQYQKYDVTKMLSGKKAELALTAGKGWAVGYLTWYEWNHLYADHMSVICSLDVTYKDGSKESFCTDGTWSVHTSHIIDSEIYHGETVDMTADIISLGKAAVDETVKTKLFAQTGEFVREQERVAPMQVIITPKGERVIDFGQNMTGYVEVRVRGNRGDRIVFTHAEVLDNDGNFYTENMRTARNRIEYVLSGGDDVFKPSFSFQGYRYIRLEEYPFETVDPDCFTSVAVYSDMKRTGFFACGDEKVNQLYHNVLWGQRSNYLDVPTDCPQRDERLGWTGDAQVFCRAGAYNFDVKKFFRKWLSDCAAEQSLRTDGGVPIVVPNGLRSQGVASAWSDCAAIVPWEMYLAYGDKNLLRENYPMMEKWINYIRHAGTIECLWTDRWQYGDWLAMDGEGNTRCTGATQYDFIASAMYANSVQCLINAGKVLGYDVSEYEKLHENIIIAFNDNFMEDGLPCLSKHVSCRIELNSKEQQIVRAITQTSLTLILKFKLYRTEEVRKKVAAKLVEIIHENGDRLSTGFVGTPYLLHVLSENGYTDVAYTLLLQEKMPSWLYSVNHGATTMWERWNCVQEDGAFSDVSMTSFNHYAYGAVADWLYGVVAGIESLADGAGYEHISLAPKPSEKLGFVNCKVETAHGAVVSKWYYGKEFIHYEFEIPSGTTAELSLVDGTKKTLSSGKYLFTTKR